MPGVWDLPQDRHKIFNRYKAHGFEALSDRCRRPTGINSLQQQARFDEFVDEFNTKREHEAL
jgi:hypothetical protein